MSSSHVNEIKGYEARAGDYNCTLTHQYKHFCRHEESSCQLRHNMHRQQPNETTYA